jgi:hypothetical protein
MIKVNPFLNYKVMLRFNKLPIFQVVENNECQKLLNLQNNACLNMKEVRIKKKD